MTPNPGILQVWLSDSTPRAGRWSYLSLTCLNLGFNQCLMFDCKGNHPPLQTGLTHRALPAQRTPETFYRSSGFELGFVHVLRLWLYRSRGAGRAIEARVLKWFQEIQVSWVDRCCFVILSNWSTLSIKSIFYLHTWFYGQYSLPFKPIFLHDFKVVNLALFSKHLKVIFHAQVNIQVKIYLPHRQNI